MSSSFSPDLSTPIDLPQRDSWPASRHRFDPTSVWAVRAALAARRPLLLRGESGIGKSQLARAVAEVARVPFLYHVVDERSERDELLFQYDAIARLAEAQVSALEAREAPKNWRSRLAERNFIRPGVLWWAFNWADAERQSLVFSQHCRVCKAPAKPADWTPDADRLCGPVVLVDEIDKADPSVPNGLLESLGNQGFQSAQLGDVVTLEPGSKPPLVMITTNEERELPAAFVRRCLVLQMEFSEDPAQAEAFLIQERARVFWTPDQVSDAVCRQVVHQLLADRASARSQGASVPGAAEFLDLIRALVELHSGNEVEQGKALKEIAVFSLKKHRNETK